MSREKNTPFVSVLIPMYNEAEYIQECLESILSTTYPMDRFEVIVIDGFSSDGCREIVRRYESNFPQVKMLDNPKRIQACALNIGLQKARGEIIIRLDAHAEYGRDYIPKCVQLLQTRGAQSVGGCMRGTGKTVFADAVAAALTSRFAAGDAWYRYATKEAWVDTAWLGAWRKRTLLKIGGFNEDFAVNEDFEAHYRLRKAGGKILLSPELESKYYARSTFSGLVRQYFRYGMWKVKTLKVHPASLRWRQIIPPLFTLAMILSLLVGWISVSSEGLQSRGALLLIQPLLYGLANLTSSAILAVRHRLTYFLLFPLIFAVMHFSWGLGFWAGVLRFGLPRIRVRVLREAFQLQE